MAASKLASTACSERHVLVVLPSRQFSSSSSPATPRTTVIYYTVASSQPLPTRQFSSSHSLATLRTKVVLPSRQFSSSQSPATLRTKVVLPGRHKGMVGSLGCQKLPTGQHLAPFAALPVCAFFKNASAMLNPARCESNDVCCISIFKLASCVCWTSLVSWRGDPMAVKKRGKRHKFVYELIRINTDYDMVTFGGVQCPLKKISFPCKRIAFPCKRIAFPCKRIAVPRSVHGSGIFQIFICKNPGGFVYEFQCT